MKQLLIEEALMRSDKHAWFIMNHGTDNKYIVLGHGRKEEKDIDIPKVKNDTIKVIRRFTGGGTVTVDHDTLFVSFIGTRELLGKETNPFPRDIMRWSEKFYKHAFVNLSAFDVFALNEDDYVLGDYKIGGNAQYITGGKLQRWVHHTSFLWDFHPKNMEYLLMPDRKPKYRKDRDHLDFVKSIKSFLGDTYTMMDFSKIIEEGLIKIADPWNAEIQIATIDEAESFIEQLKFVNTKYITF